MRQGGVRLALVLPLVLLSPAVKPPRPPAPGGSEEEPPGLGSHHAFYFTRAVYTGIPKQEGRSFRPRWAIDYPTADRHLLMGLRRLLTYADTSPEVNPVRLDDPRLGRFPFLYAVEPGGMELTESEIRGLRHYLLAGGLLVVDDFWGTAEWNSFASEMSRVLPGHPIVELPLDHPLFHVFYDIDQILQVPNVALGMAGGPTWEQDGYEAHCRGIFDGRGRLMVVINWNTDLGDAWEWADEPRYPRKYSDFAYRMAVNFIVYATTH